MKILSLGLDPAALQPDSKTAERLAAYRSRVEKYEVLTPSSQESKIWQLWRLWRKAGESLKREAFDLITAQDTYYLALVGYFLAKRHNLKLEIQVHGFEKFWGLRRRLAKFVLPRADSVRTVSQRLKTKLIKDFKIKGEKVVVVPLPLQITGGQRMGRRDDDFVFLTVGRLVPVKNISLQLRALAEIVKTQHQVKLWIVGDGPERKKLEQEAANLGLSQRVKFWGWQSELDDFYCQADAFILSSNNEGWGMAALEAAAWGLPIIMTDVGLAGELIEAGHEGLVIPVADEPALTQAMVRLIENPALRQQLGLAAQKRISGLPTVAQTAAALAENWQKILGL